jgi:hypothetical protein
VVSKGRLSQITLDVLGSEYQVLAPRIMTPILVSEAPFFLLVFMFGMGALITVLLSRL